MVKIVKEETIPRGRHTDSTVGATFFRIKQLITKSSSFSRVTGLTLLLLLFATPFVVTHRQIFQPHAAGGAPDVTSSVEMLGNPSMSRYPSDPYSRNVWDMQGWSDGNIYLGSGDFIVNTGPITLWSYNLASQTFKTNSVTGSESGGALDSDQLNNFDVVNNQLYIPDKDPRDSWDFGNYYRLDANGWTKYRNIPTGVHVNDIAYFDNKFFEAGENADVNVKYSTDSATTWQNPTFQDEGTDTIVPYFEEQFFTLNGKFYVSGVSYDPQGTFPQPVKASLSRYKDEGNITFTMLSSTESANFFPDFQNVTNDVDMMVIKHGYIGNTMVYIGGIYVNELEYDPVALFSATDTTTAKHIVLPNNATPWDILTRNGVVYILASNTLSPTATQITVYSSTDGDNFSELFHFTASTFARSFEEVNGDFYFGLGTETSPLATDSGNILRVKQAAYLGGATSPTPAPSLTPTPTVIPTPTPQSSLSVTGSVDLASLSQGGTETINTSVTNNSTTTTVTGQIQINVLNPNNTQVFSTVVNNDTAILFRPTKTTTYTVSYPLPSNAQIGTYTVSESLLSSDGTTTYFTNPAIATFTVTATPTPQPTATPTPTPQPSIPGDLNNTGRVDAIDLSILLSSWGTVNDTINQELGKPQGSPIDALSLSVLLSHWTL